MFCAFLSAFAHIISFKTHNNPYEAVWSPFCRWVDNPRLQSSPGWWHKFIHCTSRCEIGAVFFFPITDHFALYRPVSHRGEGGKKNYKKLVKSQLSEVFYFLFMREDGNKRTVFLVWFGLVSQFSQFLLSKYSSNSRLTAFIPGYFFLPKFCPSLPPPRKADLCSVV